MPTLLLSHQDLRNVYRVELGLEAVERAFRVHGQGGALMPAKVYLSLSEHDGDFRAMPAYLGPSEAGGEHAGVKWVNCHPKNPERYHLPSVRAVFVLSDPETATPLAIMDGTLLTAWRTGAAGGVASRYLARSSPRTLGLVGSGVQARVLVEAHRAVYGDLKLLFADVRSEAAERLAAEMGGKAVSMEAASGADIVCTQTPSRTPVVKREWVQPGAHVNAMGADAPGKQELDPRILLGAKIVIDDAEQALHSGEVNVPLHDGLLGKGQIHATLGEVVAGKKAGRTSEDEITVFDSTGLALQDLALAGALYELAKKKGVGTPFDLIGG